MSHPASNPNEDQSDAHHLNCTFHSQPGSVERLLRVIRVRGFRLEKISMGLREDIYEAQLTVSGSRNIHNLISQLQKLIEVATIERLLTEEPAMAAVQPLGQCA